MNRTVMQEKTDTAKLDAANNVKQYVTFVIANEIYGVPILKVQEIIGMTDIVHVPNSPEFMKGVINLRGSVVPVIDMRKRFSLEEREYDMFTVIIIVEMKNMPVGMIVDTVSDVVSIADSEIQDTPNVTSKISSDFIEGIGQVNERLVIILNIDNILSADEIEKMEREENETA